MQIKVYGIGCERDRRLVQNIKEAVNDLNLDAEIREIYNNEQVAEAGFSSNPGLTIDDQPLVVGHVLNTDELKILLHRYQNIEV